NHYHIVIETIEGNLSQGMRQLNGVYTQTSNRRHHRVGHVFQGRYKAVLVEKESYLLELCRYVVLNPIRANMVNDMVDWPWSSYAAMLGNTAPPEWLETDWLLGHFGQSHKQAIDAYSNFVRAGIGLAPIWRDLKHQIFLGHDDFIDPLKIKDNHDVECPSLKEVPRAQRRSSPKPLEWYQGQFSIRDEGIAAAYLSGGYTMKAIASGFKVHYSTVSRAIKKCENA
ncbi:addiction module toxin RelE, partial [Pseudomonadota bacterium]|nr:addiction module toxin RelE [Pseudomonadota bacterium]